MEQEPEKRSHEGDFAEGDTVVVDAQNGELVFTKTAVAEPAAA